MYANRRGNQGETIPILSIVGGFLGCGKTTLILKAAEVLGRQGARTVVIVNAQDAGLVDTQRVLAQNELVREVANGCFCCRFSEFVAAARDLATHKPDIVFAEPVGSCTDLYATVMRPLRELYGSQFSLAPLTVLLDPVRIEDRLNASLNADIAYLAANQLAEADIVCATRRDLWSNPLALPIPIDFHVSGITGQGVEEWLEEVLEPTRVLGARLLDIDYARYAQAEGALGWLNLHAHIELASSRSPALLCGPLLDAIENALTQSGIVIAHLKIFDRAPSAWVTASIGGNGSQAIPNGDLMAEAATRHELALNLRAIAEPEALKECVLRTLAKLRGELRITHLRAFSPPAPSPEYRKPGLTRAFSSLAT